MTRSLPGALCALGLLVGGCFDNPFDTTMPDLSSGAVNPPPPDFAVPVDHALYFDLACPPGERFHDGACCRPTPANCCGLPLCNGACVELFDDNNCGECGNVCPPGVHCGTNSFNGQPIVQCLCPLHQSRCPVNGVSTCVDTPSDSHCGFCGNVCTRGSHCVPWAHGIGYQCSCPEGLTRCGDLCVDLKFDDGNCGQCGSICRSGCDNGQCCLRNGSMCGGFCLDLTDGTTLDVPPQPAFCGACGVVCPTASTCVLGQCKSNGSYKTCGVRAGGCIPGTQCINAECGCSPGLTNCFGAVACVDLAADPTHCGACGTSCAQGKVCSGGTCKAQCDPGLTLCGSSCVNPSTSQLHCGRCGGACGGGTGCVNGQCVCPVGQTLCNGACTVFDTDAANCGGCGRTCGANQWCVKSACVCRSDMTPCGNTCVHLDSDVNNCGACGRACPAGQGYRCVRGLCV